MEAPLSTVLANKDKRIDSDFFTKGTAKNPSLTYVKIGAVLHSSEYGASIDMNEDSNGVQIYRMNEIHDMLCDLSAKKCAQMDSEGVQKYALNDGDILFNRTNSYEMVGRCGIYYKRDSAPRIFASYLVRFFPKLDQLTAEYLATFLNTAQGVSEVRRRARQSVNQTNVNPEEVKEIEIPLLGMEFQKKIRQMFINANKKRLVAAELYCAAETQLISELGFADWKPTSKTVAVRKCSDFMAAGRFDAEYFQPDCDLLAKKLAGYSHGCVSASEMLQQGLVKSGSGEIEKYVELADIGDSGEIVGCMTAPFDELPTRARQRVRAGDVIVSSIEGSLERCALVDGEYDGALCSTGFHRFRSPKINPETMMLLFKSAPIQRLLKRGCSGTILCGILPGEFQHIEIPIVQKSVQDAIAKKIQDSFTARKESKRLLELAKRAVEVAIESGESAGYKMLNDVE